MCLGIPALIKKMDGTFGDVDMGGIETRVSVLFTPEAKVGDYVMVHAGFAITIMADDEAAETLELLQQAAAGHEE
jgi:hydrogenase expression/formation protein HypC